MELTLNSYKIFELGNHISTFLHDCGITKGGVLNIKVNKEELRKIDEDLYYRQNPKGDDFIPSDNEIQISFPNVSMIIQCDVKPTSL